MLYCKTETGFWRVGELECYHSTGGHRKIQLKDLDRSKMNHHHHHLYTNSGISDDVTIRVMLITILWGNNAL